MNGNNIKNLRKERKVSQEELAKALGISQPSMSLWENDDNLSFETAETIAKYFGVSIYDVTGKKPEEYSIYNHAPDMAEIEIINVTASCGYGLENFHPEVVGRHLISRASLREITNSDSESIKILKIRGDSMQPTINDSDVVWVDISKRNANSDGLYLFCIGNDLFVKRLQVDFINNMKYITSDNPKYKPIETKEEVYVLGKIISITKMLG